MRKIIGIVLALALSQMARADLCMDPTTGAWNTCSASATGPLAAPGPIGGGTPSTGAFTTLSVTGALTSTLATGTAPFTVASTTNVANLNASTLSGKTFASPAAIGSGTPAAGNFTTLGATGLISPTSSVGVAGTILADSPAAGSVGEVVSINCIVGAAAAAATTITVTIATPAVVTWSSHTFVPSTSLANYACPINFTTSSALPTGITVGTNYWIIGSSVSGDTFQISDTAAHALAGTNAVATSGSQSGTQSAYIGALGTNGASFVGAAFALVAGDWDCNYLAEYQELTSLTASGVKSAISTTTSLPAIGLFAQVDWASGSIGANNQYIPSPVVPANISGTTNYFGLDNSVFSGGTMNEAGLLRCRRMR